MMRYSQIRSMDISNGEGIGVAVFTQGCPIHCFNCFNSETWDFDKGKEWTQKEEDRVIELMKPTHIKRLSILGGEPLIERNITPLTNLLKRVRKSYPEKRIYVYTGQQLENIKLDCIELFSLIDVLIDGPYIDSKKDYSLKLRGSSNQRLINMNATFNNWLNRNEHLDNQTPFIASNIVIFDESDNITQSLQKYYNGLDEIEDIL